MSRWTRLWLHALVMLYSILALLPILLAVSISFSDEIDLLRDDGGYRLWPRHWSLEAYRFLWTGHGYILRTIGFTLGVAVVGSVLGVLVMALYAYPISQRRFPHRRFFTWIALVPTLFSPGLVPWYWVYAHALKIGRSYWALVLPLMVSGASILLLRTFFKQALTDDQIDAARTDGADEWSIFARLLLLLSRPIWSAMLLFQAVQYWNDWATSLWFRPDFKRVNVNLHLWRVHLDIYNLFGGLKVTTSTAIDASVKLKVIPQESAAYALLVVTTVPFVLFLLLASRCLLREPRLRLDHPVKGIRSL